MTDDIQEWTLEELVDRHQAGFATLADALAFVHDLLDHTEDEFYEGVIDRDTDEDRIEGDPLLGTGGTLRCEVYIDHGLVMPYVVDAYLTAGEAWESRDDGRYYPTGVMTYRLTHREIVEPLVFAHGGDYVGMREKKEES